jgi:cytochrome b6-f complex iron-sulfur subunit
MLPDKKIFVFRDRQGIKALSAVCTHLGCMLTKIPDGFQCPCHGSCFNPAGKVKFGPAPRSLSWYGIEINPNGLLYVDISKKVDSETIFTP